MSVHHDGLIDVPPVVIRIAYLAIYNKMQRSFTYNEFDTKLIKNIFGKNAYTFKVISVLLRKYMPQGKLTLKTL